MMTIQRFLSAGAKTLAATFLAMTIAVPASWAHVRATVGEYGFVFGVTEEPVITGRRMWFEILVANLFTEEPMDGLVENLEFVLRFGNAEWPLELRADYGQPGRYEAPVIFNTPGKYQVILTGSIEGTDVELEFEKEVLDHKSLVFPSGPSR